MSISIFVYLHVLLCYRQFYKQTLLTIGNFNKIHLSSAQLPDNVEQRIGYYIILYRRRAAFI